MATIGLTGSLWINLCCAIERSGGFDVLQEPFGLVLVKAMMCGTPIAAMRLGAVTEIVDEDVTGCTTGNTAEFCQTVLRAMARLKCVKRQSRPSRRIEGSGMCGALHPCDRKRMIS
jgi:glycosyltransferase involved in cell wall biosynthesis